MAKIIIKNSILICLITLPTLIVTGCVTVMSDETQAELQGYVTTAKIFQGKQSDIIKTNGNPDEAFKQVFQLKSIYSDISTICLDKNRVTGPFVKSCYTYFDQVKTISTDMQFAAANYYLKNCQLKNARTIYRGLYQANIDDPNSPIRKKAVLGLEDVKAAKCD
jgi:hypothetical protein